MRSEKSTDNFVYVRTATVVQGVQRSTASCFVRSSASCFLVHGVQVCVCVSCPRLETILTSFFCHPRLSNLRPPCASRTRSMPSRRGTIFCAAALLAPGGVSARTFVQRQVSSLRGGALRATRRLSMSHRQSCHIPHTRRYGTTSCDAATSDRLTRGCCSVSCWTSSSC